MKKILSTIAISALISTSAMAVEFVKGGVYGGFGVGYEADSRYSSVDGGMTVVLNGGKAIVKLGPGVIGAEGEFTYTAIPLDYYSHDLTITTFGGFATYTYDMSNKLYARAKAGIVHSNRSYDYDKNGLYDYDYTVTSEAIGIGGGIKLNSHMKLYSELIALDGFDLKQFNVGVQIGF